MIIVYCKSTQKSNSEPRLLTYLQSNKILDANALANQVYKFDPKNHEIFTISTENLKSKSNNIHKYEINRANIGMVKDNAAASTKQVNTTSNKKKSNSMAQHVYANSMPNMNNRIQADESINNPQPLYANDEQIERIQNVLSAERAVDVEGEERNISKSKNVNTVATSSNVVISNNNQAVGDGPHVYSNTQVSTIANLTNVGNFKLLPFSGACPP